MNARTERVECEICGEPYDFDSALGCRVPSCNCMSLTMSDSRCRPDMAEPDGLNTSPTLKVSARRRKLSLQESALLQGFPADYLFVGSDRCAWK